MKHLPDETEIFTQFGKLLVALVTDGVDLAVAVIFNGYPRLTLDADIIVHDSPENLRTLLASLAGWGEGWAREPKPEDFVLPDGSIRGAHLDPAPA